MASASSQPPKYVKVTVYITRSPDCTHEEFHRWWTEKNAQVLMQNEVFRENIRRYNQYHITPELREAVEDAGLPTLDYDGVQELWFDSVDDWKDVMSNLDFVMAIDEDESRFVIQNQRVMIGYDNLVFGKEVLP
ncbi:uncharacterized protein BDZ99DRAFT_445737 [Mytilinidion resinicola]|uniref:EthD domain-containing protein n=1 Tax=Mytilinidion resinicola TaxID=574789 RepID=A0A6A6YIK6_9PEZI|nr:uncharacterized protein BDZ99DRAFT_445737 [Mytilinidion resinicola]KAF2808353.1 hypothetical protein BDZ99DRAFT_445737 [Mytilinidion resinicola]